ncbi:M28 family metallopeptidase [Thermoactinospora rubra]|uniref:M28 family metallopeptidase n=1 Tax=Thermoactinospora rubra TaxID=1088767 RepID=UPI000A10DAC1|nr:M28 family metallopeptidase [Thermoactinospora rubra]
MITHAMLALALAAPAPAPSPLEVSLDDILGHLQAFQAIAQAHGGNRAAGEPGYDASADYVAARLQEAGYEVERQPFTFPFYRELAPAQVVGDQPFAGVTTLRMSGSGQVTARPQRVGQGCTPRAYAGFERGRVAVADRGGCTFQVKAVNAARSGAAALVVVNQKDEPFSGGMTTPQSIPVVGVGSGVGAAIADLTRVTVSTTTLSEERVTHNVIAQTRTGDPDQVIMVGAHLDSVEDGPGMNDNASGAATVLELALNLARSKPIPLVRFAWWGAEEEGLVGSTRYVAQLTKEERGKIKAYLNLDMIASPNGIYGIFDGDDSEKLGGGPGPVGSAAIERAFEAFFKRHRLPYLETDLSGRSDYAPFVAIGVPSGGLFTGAEATKTARQAELFGGTAGSPFDPCYHKACDTLDNINQEALKVTSGAVGFVLRKLAFELGDAAS